MSDVGALRIGLGGDTMLGRLVGDRLKEAGPDGLWGPGLLEVAAEADAVVVNLECCISERGEPWPDRVFHFRAPPSAVAALQHLGVDAVTLANNHALDFGPDALLDTLALLDEAGIAHAGAGADVDAARAPAVLDVAGTRVAIVGLTDHPAEYAATGTQPGVAHATLDGGPPPWLAAAIATADADVTVVSPHWGPNMVASPVPHVAAAAEAVAGLRPTVVAGHSAHVFHGVQRHAGVPVLYDLGDLLDDYAVEPRLRNDRGLFWLLDVDDSGAVTRVEAVPIELTLAHTEVAAGEVAAWVAERFTSLCAAIGTPVRHEGERLVLDGAG